VNAKESNVHKMKAAVVTEPEGAIQVVERNLPYPLERAAQAYDRMMSGGASFRVVVKMDGSPTGRS
jgi:D-arabinose 1-dehydrogenase-like Zn-dependent alcohol dehydrogenase